ncbi:hypothetical protein [Rhodococcus sp. NPDC058514]|uniref:hypothetical protein n=1 Tax=unclassified Rhodococcus (in: high G+C Gram-positive bacteria) TaxID=192944 RepID=UPI0036556F95
MIQNLFADMRLNMFSDQLRQFPGQVRRFPEKLSLFSEWVGYALGLVALLTFALTVVAAASGFTGWAIVAGLVCVACLLIGSSIVSSAVRHDHKVHQHTPRFPLPGGERWPVR